jgi:LEA14-like dessication related protein
MRYITSLIIISSLLLGCASLSRYKETPSINLVSLNLLESTLFEQRYQLKFRIQNPNAVSMPVTGMNFTLEINGKKFMTGLSNQEASIPAYSDSVIAATGSTTLFGIARQIQGMKDNEKATFAYRLSGKLGIQNQAFAIPFDVNGTFSPE